MLATGLLGIIVATVSPSGKNGQYAVIAPPWYTLGQTVSLIQHADGLVADMRSGRHVVIAQSNEPGFVSKLYRAGAWLVLDPIHLRGCGSTAARDPKARS
ncbi:hypothetical protein [Sphingobium sp. EM0848]|uniref:hypothetical protein n=1 Tax=Sphingobium sp. EM0848 TaxID=2743473 RepID=UPI00159BF207|nr:hypothetical protein [Sphingobium sp. EM0848]